MSKTGNPNELILSVSDPTTALEFLREELHRRMVIKWRCKDGTLIDVKKMNYFHLCKTIDMLERIEYEREIISENGGDAT